MNNVSTLRPGLLVALATSVKGNVSYTKVDIEPDHDTGDGSRRARWETQRDVADADEHLAAVATRGRVRSLIRSACVSSGFGYLCPQSKSDQLRLAVTEAHALVDAFNKGASLTRVNVAIMVGRIEENDVEAIRAINGEVRDLLETMERGIANCDAESIRKAATAAKGIGSMLQPEAASRIADAVATARRVAKELSKAGTQASVMVDRAAIDLIAAQRGAFLDLEAYGSDVAAPVAGVSLDLAPVDETISAPPAPAAIEL